MRGREREIEEGGKERERGERRDTEEREGWGGGYR